MCPGLRQFGLVYSTKSHLIAAVWLLAGFVIGSMTQPVIAAASQCSSYEYPWIGVGRERVSRNGREVPMGDDPWPSSTQLRLPEHASDDVLFATSDGNNLVIRKAR
jgi:hypothetical protein